MGPGGNQPTNQNRNPLAFQVGNNNQYRHLMPAVMDPQKQTLANKISGDSTLPQTMTNPVTSNTMVQSGKGGKGNINPPMRRESRFREYLQ